MYPTPASPRCAAALILAGLLVGCGPVELATGVERYGEAVAEAIGAEDEVSAAGTSTRLPRRRERRVEVGEPRIGSLEFLGLIGCRLSEVVAARNAGMGRVLQPTRRLSHELDVIEAAAECLPALADEPAARLRALLADKRGELGAHVWNAVWLDEELERFLTGGPPALLGGGGGTDAAGRLEAAATALAAGPSGGPDVAALESALRGLRDDPSANALLRDLAAVRRVFDDVAERLTRSRVTTCDARGARLARVFEQRYLPLQTKLAALDRPAHDLLNGLAALYRASSRGVEVPEPMRAFAAEVLDIESSQGLWRGYRAALARHSEAWSPVLVACDVLPGSA